MALDSVFKLITDNPAEINDYELRSKRFNEVVDFIESQGFGIEELSVKLNASIEDVNDFMMGGFSKFTAESLLDVLNRIGFSWKTATKLQINKKVAEILGLKAAKENGTMYNSDYREKYPDTVWTQKDGCAWEQFNPCVEPEDFWKIIYEYQIDIEWPFDKRKGYVELWVVNANFVCEFEAKEDVFKAAMLALIESEGF